MQWTVQSLQAIHQTIGMDKKMDGFGRSFGASMFLEIERRYPHTFHSIVAAAPFSPAPDWLRMITHYYESGDSDFAINEAGFNWANGPKGLRSQWQFMNKLPRGRQQHAPVLLLSGFFDDQYPNRAFEFAHDKIYPNLPVDEVWNQLAQRNSNISTTYMPGSHFVLTHYDPVVRPMSVQIIKSHMKDPENTPTVIAELQEKLDFHLELRQRMIELIDQGLPAQDVIGQITQDLQNQGIAGAKRRANQEYQILRTFYPNEKQA